MIYLSEKEINEYIELNGKYFEKSKIPQLKNMLTGSNLTLEELNTCKLKSPTIGILLSVFLGTAGFDRFYSGDYTLGILKLCTFGCCGILWLVDIFLIGKAIKKVNLNKFIGFLNGVETNSPDLKTLLKSKEFRMSIKKCFKSAKEFFDSFSDGMY